MGDDDDSGGSKFVKVHLFVKVLIELFNRCFIKKQPNKKIA